MTTFDELLAPELDAEWCDCEGIDREECVDSATFSANGKCIHCPVHKQHYHGAICGKLTQIG